VSCDTSPADITDIRATSCYPLAQSMAGLHAPSPVSSNGPEIHAKPNSLMHSPSVDTNTPISFSTYSYPLCPAQPLVCLILVSDYLS
jgi:hypothetical protein